jgi:hypothetical protein
MRNLQEGRHALAEKIFHGGALGIVLNCVVRTGVLKGPAGVVSVYSGPAGARV